MKKILSVFMVLIYMFGYVLAFAEDSAPSCEPQIEKAGTYKFKSDCSKECVGYTYNKVELTGNAKKCCNIGNIVMNTGGIYDCVSCSKIVRNNDDNDTFGGYTKQQISDAASKCEEDVKKDYFSAGSAGAGIECSIDQLTYGQCKFNVYDTLGIRKSVRSEGDETEVGLFIQDIVLSATMFIGTIVTIALLVSGLMFIFSGVDSGLKAKAKSGVINAIIGLLIVASSYFIIRLVQFIARGN